MANKIRVKLILELRDAHMSRNGIAAMHIPLKLHADSDCICTTVSDRTAYLSA